MFIKYNPIYCFIKKVNNKKNIEQQTKNMKHVIKGAMFEIHDLHLSFKNDFCHP